MSPPTLHSQIGKADDGGVLARPTNAFPKRISEKSEAQGSAASHTERAEKAYQPPLARSRTRRRTMMEIDDLKRNGRDEVLMVDTGV